MGVFAGPDISESGLVLALDGANYKSFKGEVTTNLIPSPTINAYPTTGNGWGTYNTNQYNRAQYFSIGSISSVSNNIITTSTNHPLRTYDVVRPQTTGGGVTSGTDYFVKKLSDTTFTLHAYNSSQDGSQGYINPSTGTHKVYDSIANDTRISVNATSFPTMWRGSPHLPNSGLVKELRYGEFNAIPNLPANDCIRLHYIRTDDVKDGMSYGVDCTVTPSSPVTISFYTRSANANAVGKVVQYYIYNYSGGNPVAYSWYFALGPLGVWQRQTFTYTPANQVMISYWFPQSSGTYAWDWSCMQVEQKSYVTNFVAGTRGTTVATGGGWADLTGNGNHGELVNGVRESSDNLGALIFDGTNDFISVTKTSQFDFGTSNFAIEIFCNLTSKSSSYPCIFSNYSSYGSGAIYFGYEHDGVLSKYSIHVNGTSYLPSSSNVTYNVWTHLTLVRSSGVLYFYINGVLDGTPLNMSSSLNGNGSLITIGKANDGSSAFTHGKIANFKIYKKALTPQEVQQNFNANRSRFGI